MPADFLEEYRRKEYQKHLKTIVTQANATLRTDYNLITFDLLKPKALLQILSDILAHLALLPPAINSKDEKSSIMDIFSALSNVKYDPQQLDPNEFREGIVKAERKVIYPILHWVLTNKKLVEKRAYLCKYVKKTDVPLNVMGDVDLQTMAKEYDAVIEEFWSVYRKNKRSKMVAEETEELDNDIVLIKKDIANISLRLEKQNDKIKDVQKKETFLEMAKLFQDGGNRTKKLSEQLRDATALMNSLDETRKMLRQHLERQKMARILKMSPIEQFLKDLSMNKLIFINQLPREVLTAKRDVDLCELIANGYVPTRSDLEAFKTKIEIISKEVNRLAINKSCMNAEINLDLFRKHVEILACKKKDISEIVCQMEQNLKEVDLAISENAQKQHDLVGGEVLRGEKLKSYVANLKDQSVTYKKLKPLLQAATAELSAQKRTLDILFLSDPNLAVNLANRDELYKQTRNIDNVEEIKAGVRTIIKEIEFKKMRLAQKRDEFMNLEALISSISRIYYEDKEVYDNIIGGLAGDIQELKEQIELSEVSIKDKCEMKQKLNKEIKNKEELYVRLSEEYINAIGDSDSEFPTMRDALNERLKALEHAKHLNLQEKIKLERVQRENEEQHAMYTKVVNIFACNSYEFMH